MDVPEAEAVGLHGCQGRLENRQLLGRVGRVFVGAGKMGVDAFRFEMIHGLQVAQQIQRIPRQRAQPPHAAIDFDMNFQLAVRLLRGLLHRPRLFQVKQRDANVLLNRLLDSESRYAV